MLCNSGKTTAHYADVEKEIIVECYIEFYSEAEMQLDRSVWIRTFVY